MTLVDAIELFPLGERRSHRRTGHLDLMLSLLHALAQSEQPYADVKATEPRKPRKHRT